MHYLFPKLGIGYGLSKEYADKLIAAGPHVCDYFEAAMIFTIFSEKDCPLCDNCREVVIRPTRLIGATYLDEYLGDERLEPCPLCCEGELSGYFR